MSDTKILVFGSDGQVGHELLTPLQSLGQVVGLNRTTCDLSIEGNAAHALEREMPNMVVNAAAYTAVDRAESEPEIAAMINTRAVEEMANACAAARIPFVHYSTDYVFDGQVHHPYSEDHPTAPLGVYGVTKWRGEEAVRAAGGPYLILRTAWVYSRRGNNFLKTIQRLARERTELRIVDDQIGAPTWARSIAEGTAEVLQKVASQNWTDCAGTYHLTAVGETSWHGFAEAIVEHMSRIDDAFTAPPVVGIPTADYPTPAQRPAYSVLSNEKLERTFGITLPDWQTQLASALED